MGHTTRCISLMRQLQNQGNTLIFAGNQAQREFIAREFSNLKTIHLDGYNVSLDPAKSTYLQMLWQLAKIKKAIEAENQAVQKLVLDEKIDLVLSDNRYGLFSSSTKNILITHQLNLKLPVMGSFVNRKIKHWVEKFDCVWVPDNAVKPVCGELLNARVNVPVVFIGHLCRFKKQAAPVNYDLLAIVSGPEPARTDFANKLKAYLGRQDKRVALVGASGNNSAIAFFENPSSAELEKLINESDVIISRAGYTTIMELLTLEKKAILIPTPGQFEQEYLATVIKSTRIRFVDEKTFFKKDG